MSERVHTNTAYENELAALRDRVLLMGATVEEVLTGSVQAFRQRDPVSAARLAKLDPQVDRLEMEIDEACLSVLARRQPVASDLRFVTAILKVVTDLERVGDLATNICERVCELDRNVVTPGTEEIVRMAELTSNMLRDALDAFVASNANKAREVRARDQQVDDLYAALFPFLVSHIKDHPEACDDGMRVLSVAKYLERIADHSTNVAEMVVFMVKGHDVRHSGGDEAEAS